MRVLNKKLMRDLLAHKVQFGAIVIIVTIGILVFTAMLLMPRMLERDVAAVLDETDYESFAIGVAGAPGTVVSELSGISNVSAVEGRVVREAVSEVRGRRPTMRVISVPDAGRPTVNDVMVDSGEYLSAGSRDQCLLERHLAGELGVEVGDSIGIMRDGSSVPLEVTGIVTSPEYLRYVSGGGVLMTDPSQFGVLFVRRAAVDALFGAPRDNSFAFKVVDEIGLEAAMEEAEALLEPYGVTAATTGAGEPALRGMNMDIQNIRNSAAFFGLIFLGISALVIYITVARMVYSQRRQVGIAKAMGYDDAPILRHYVFLGLAVAVTGGILGAVLGLPVSGAIVGVYSHALELPHMGGMAQPFDVMAVAVSLSAAAGVLGALLPALHSARMRPAEAMRDSGGATGKPPRGPTASSRLPSWLRLPMRELGRNRRRTVFTLAVLIFAFGLVICINVVSYSLDHMFDKQYRGVFRWDVAVSLDAPRQEGYLADVRTVPGVEAVEPAIDIPARIVKGGRSVDIHLQACREDTAMHESYPVGGSPGEPPPGGLLVNRSVTRELPIESGDTVKVVTALGTVPFEVAGFVNEPFGGIAYADMKYLQDLAGGPVFNLLWVKTAPGSDRRVAGALAELPGVSGVETKAQTVEVLSEMMNTGLKPLFNFVLLMVMIIAAAITVSFVIINVLERRREIATMLTVGAGGGLVARLLTVETVTLGLLVLPPGILLGWALVTLLSTKVFNARFISMEIIASPLQVAALAVALVAVMGLAALVPVRGLSRMDLARETRDRAG